MVVCLHCLLLLVPQKSEASDVEESKIGNEESDLEDPCVIPHSPVTVDKRPLAVKSPKVEYHMLNKDRFHSKSQTL